MNKTTIRLSLLLALGLLCGNALAQAAPAANLPEWDKLTPQQRETLISPMRDRWNSSPDERARMFEHANRWKSMTPEQRQQARKGMRRFEHMGPEQRREARALFFKMRGMTPEQRQQLRNQWGKMTPEQRREWMDKNAPRRDEMPPMPPPKD